MVPLILEQSVIDKLTSVAAGVEVRDRQGNLVGFFHPAIAPHEIAQYECSVSDEELQRRQGEGGGRPLQDILGDLRKTR